MADKKFDDLVKIMTNDQTPRVWSLLVSLFGDLAQGDGEAISGPTLNRIMDTIGIKPEAVRVALHRLRKEGWLQSERQGRVSLYSLTAMGRAETLAASPRIYEKADGPQEAWLVIYQPGVEKVEGLSVTSNIAISAHPPKGHEPFALRLTETDKLPDWMIGKLFSVDLIAQTCDAAKRLSALKDTLDGTPGIDAVETAVLRSLVVHIWRRIALRIPPLPGHLFPTTWCGSDAEETAHALLHNMPAPALDDLENA